MPDMRHPQLPAIGDWQQAFAALPLETPPAGGWERVAAALPRRRSRARIWIPAAVAASLALVMAWPWHSRSPEPPTADRVAGTSAPAIVPAPTPAPSPATDTAPATHARPSALADASNEGGKGASERADVPATVSPPVAPRHRDAPAPKREVRSAIADAAAAPAPAAESLEPAAAPALETLYAQSAQLEALLAQIRDDRVASGPAMALSTELHEHVASLDAALSQPDLGADARLDLWRQRVATLRRLAGVEGTQRWMAANGLRADGEIAQVY